MLAFLPGFLPLGFGCSWVEWMFIQNEGLVLKIEVSFTAKLMEISFLPSMMDFITAGFSFVVVPRVFSSIPLASIKTYKASPGLTVFCLFGIVYSFSYTIISLYIVAMGFSYR